MNKSRRLQEAECTSRNALESAAALIGEIRAQVNNALDKAEDRLLHEIMARNNPMPVIHCANE